jgi:hypothetical protein
MAGGRFSGWAGRSRRHRNACPMSPARPSPGPEFAFGGLFSGGKQVHSFLATSGSVIRAVRPHVDGVHAEAVKPRGRHVHGWPGDHRRRPGVQGAVEPVFRERRRCRPGGAAAKGGHGRELRARDHARRNRTGGGAWTGAEVVECPGNGQLRVRADHDHPLDAGNTAQPCRERRGGCRRPRARLGELL